MCSYDQPHLYCTISNLPFLLLIQGLVKFLHIKQANQLLVLNYFDVEDTSALGFQSFSFLYLLLSCLLQVEHEEMMEFEMLENAAENSLLSQFSLSQSSMQSTLPYRRLQLQHYNQRKMHGKMKKQQNQQVHQEQEEEHQQKAEQQLRQLQQLQVHQMHQEELQHLHHGDQFVETSESGPVSGQELNVPIEDVLPLVADGDGSNFSSGPGSDVIDLDNTLKGSPSLAKGVEFDDDEAWDSFSQKQTDHPLSRCNSQSSLSVASSDDTLPTSSSPAVKQSSPPFKTTILPPPPSSALVSRLFPALSKVEERPPRLVGATPRSEPPRQVESGKATSPVSSAGEDSGFSGASERGSEIASHSSVSGVGISEELKHKLSELEQEILRYRKENQDLEILRKEREQVKDSL